MKNKLLLLFFAISIVLLSCKKKDAIEDVNNDVPPTETVKGVFILNEGTFTYANSSLSLYNIEKDEVTNNMFFRVNDAPIGDVGQSLTKIGKSLYIVVNNSKYIYKVNANSIKYQAKIEGFTSPRYMLPVSNKKAYVSDLESTGIWVVNLSNSTISKFIETGNTTEAMVKVGDEVFVSNWSNYYTSGATSNRTVQVVDCVNDVVVDEIAVAKEPSAMVVDKNNHIWVSCSGDYMPPCEPAIICIDAATHQVINRFDLAEGSYPSGLAIDGEGENIFFMNGGYGTLNVYKMSVDAAELPDTPFITSNSRVFYNLKVDPNNGDIYITDAKNYVQNGDLLRYSSEGTLICTHELGIIPSYMLFN